MTGMQAIIQQAMMDQGLEYSFQQQNDDPWALLGNAHDVHLIARQPSENKLRPIFAVLNMESTFWLENRSVNIDLLGLFL